MPCQPSEKKIRGRKPSDFPAISDVFYSAIPEGIYAPLVSLISLNVLAVCSPLYAGLFAVKLLRMKSIIAAEFSARKSMMPFSYSSKLPV